MERPTCQTCPYWDSKQQGAGNCRRHPPRFLNWDDSHRDSIQNEDDPWTGWWPETYRTEWCGEHPDFPAYLAGRQKQEIVDLASRIGEPEEVVLAKAMAFYKDALEAEQRGERVAILNTNDEIVRELTGFGPPSPAGRTDA